MPRRVVDLAGSNWQLGQSPPGARPDHATWDELARVHEWLPATVPGNVRADLIQAGRLPGLALGTEPEAAQWVDDHCWWLVREFALSLAPSERANLVLRGVDYISDLFLNGQKLDHHEGMFSPQVLDVTVLLRAENRLAVRLVGSRWLPRDRSTHWEQLLNQIEAKFSNVPGRFPHRRDTLKCQMGFGWDFAPPLRTMGIWDDVYLVVSRNVFIQDIATRQCVTDEEAVIAALVKIDARQGGPALLRLTLSAETFEGEPVVVEQPVELPTGPSQHNVELTVPRPHLWWPWDHGRPDLYRLTAELWAGDKLEDSVARTIGLRQVKLKGWTLYINGRRVYARGANWVPPDLLPGRVTGADYSALLTLARQANMNMLRVWGGGLREKRTFYDLCDQMGILLWQEFPFACAFLTRYPRSRGYLRLVESEARAIIRDLRYHPSLVLWCGGNEFSPRRNAPLLDALRRVVEAEDPARPFLPASPTDGDSHNWQVWHNYQPPSRYRDDRAVFASEFGLQAPPDAATLRRFIPAEDLWPPGPSWAYHGAGLEKLWRYAQPFLSGKEASIESFVAASQRAQAHGLQIAVEHYRRRKANGCGGVLIWQLNEPWPAISWALIDFYRQRKPAYETVKRLYNPLLISVDYPLKRFESGGRFDGRVWMINDLSRALPGCLLEVTLWDGDRQPLSRFVRIVDVAPDSAEIVGDLHWELPAGGDWRLTCRLTRDGQVLATNEYDLSACDSIQPTVRQRLRTWFVGMLMPA